MKNVRKDTGIRCSKLGRALSFSCQIFLVSNGGIRIIDRKLSTAVSKSSKKTSPVARRRSIRIAMIAPDMPPAARICFQSMYSLVPEEPGACK